MSCRSGIWIGLCRPTRCRWGCPTCMWWPAPCRGHTRAGQSHLENNLLLGVLLFQEYQIEMDHYKPEKVYVRERTTWMWEGLDVNWHPLVGWFLSLIGHLKHLKQLCTYLIGWGLYSCLNWLGIVHKCVIKFSLVWSCAKMSQPGVLWLEKRSFDTFKGLFRS